MEVLPEAVLNVILGYLSIKEIYSCTIYVNKLLYSLATNPALTKELIRGELRIHQVPLLTSDQYKLLIKENLLSSTTDSLRFFGVCTDGGIDEDNGVFWFGNVFNEGKEVYCTREQKENANVAGVLYNSHPQLSRLEFVENRVQEIFEYWADRHSSVFATHWFRDIVEVFDFFVTSMPLNDIVLEGEDPQEFLDSMTSYIEFFKNLNSDCVKARRYPDNPFILEHKFVDQFDESSTLACFHGFSISRDGEFTCPVATLLIFTSEVYIDVTNEAFTVYDGLNTKEKLRDQLRTDSSIPNAFQETEASGVEFVEFESTRAALKPMLWVKFLESPRVSKVEYYLTRRLCGAFMYVKLIDAENRREERQWTHEFMNIDIAHCVPRGRVIHLRNP